MDCADSAIRVTGDHCNPVNTGHKTVFELSDVFSRFPLISLTEDDKSMTTATGKPVSAVLQKRSASLTNCRGGKATAGTSMIPWESKSKRFKVSQLHAFLWQRMYSLHEQRSLTTLLSAVGFFFLLPIRSSPFSPELGAARLKLLRYIESTETIETQSNEKSQTALCEHTGGSLVQSTS